MDAGADLNQWFAFTSAGEPYDDNPQTKGMVDEIAEHHSSYYIADDRAPAPLYLQRVDRRPLPADEALRFYNRTRDRHPEAAIKLMFFDWGHMRGQGKQADTSRMNQAIVAWFGHWLKGEGPRPSQRRHRAHADVPQGGAVGWPVHVGQLARHASR